MPDDIKMRDMVKHKKSATQEFSLIYEKPYINPAIKYTQQVGLSPDNEPAFYPVNGSAFLVIIDSK